MNDHNLKHELSELDCILWATLTIGHVVLGLEAFQKLGFHEAWGLYWGFSLFAVGFSALLFVGLKDKTAPARRLWREYKPDIFKTAHERVMEVEPLYDYETNTDDFYSY